MKILVTGGAGFVGSHIIDELNKNGHKVVVVDNLSTGSKRNVCKGVKFYKTDIRSKNLEDIFRKEKFNAVCHVAAKTNMRETLNDPLKDISINVVGMVKLLELCKKYKIKKFVFSSTGGALYGNTKNLPTTENTPTRPISPYGVDKLTGERYLYYYHHVHDLSVVILRYSNIYGPRLERKKGGACATMKFIQTILKGDKLTITGDGKQTRDFVYVGDVAKANCLALTQKKKGYFIYNISSGKETSINMLVSLLQNKLKTDVRPYHAKKIRGEVLRSFLSNKKAIKELGWKPKYDLESGIIETLKYLNVV